MSDSTVTRTELADGGARYSIELNADAEAVLARAAELHSCTPETIPTRAIGVYVSAFDELVRIAAIAVRDDIPRH